MKTIKIFLASSEELDYDRMAFGNLVRRLDDMYEKRGIRIKLFEWEDYDAAYNKRRKQDEYNDHVRQSDIFLALFHRNAYYELAWTYHLMGKYEDAFPWAEKAVATSPNNPGIIDTLATVHQGLGKYDEALEQFELCLKLKKEQGFAETSIHETEEKIEELQELMK